MADIAKTRAQVAERLKATEEQAQALRKQLAALDTALAVAQSYEDGTQNVSVPEFELPQESTQPRKRPRNPSHEEVGDAALAILAKADKPMSRADLFEEVTKTGLNIQGQDPQVVFSTMMWRERERVVNLKRFGYWPIDKPYERAGYYPGD